MAVLMLLIVAGLLRTLTQQDRDRAERAMEAYLASKDEPQKPSR
jgi:cbb3-type cytochrome oxidase subunit 3